MNRVGFLGFREVFAKNIHNRSRTARGRFVKGMDGKSSNPLKLDLLKTGDELLAQVAQNTEKLIARVWDNAYAVRHNRFSFGVFPEDIRRLAEGWYDITQEELQDVARYEELQREFFDKAKFLEELTGIPFRFNSRYRIWTPDYLPVRIDPIQIDLYMDRFYRALSGHVTNAMRDPHSVSQANLLAWADSMIDGVIHPWLDGCGRNSVAMVMWISLVVGGWKLPVCAEKKEHYKTIRAPRKHAEYFAACLS